jgi:DNA-binding XRE family transcriptional regulator
VRTRKGITPRPGLAGARKRAGYNQQSLADLVGVTKHTVSQWETGNNNPNPNRRRLIAYHLGISLEDLDRLLRGEPLLSPGSHRCRQRRRSSSGTTSPSRSRAKDVSFVQDVPR